MTLDQLSDHLLAAATEKLSKEQKELVDAKWSKIRPFISQNIGLKGWGSHLLQYDRASLEKSAASILAGVEMIGFRPWKHEAEESHLDAICRLFFDDYSSLSRVDFTTGEKLAFFWEYDPSLIAQFRGRFEKIFSDLYQEMVWTRHDTLVTHMLIGNLIALYPYFDPPEGHTVRLLQHINGEWRMVDYRVELVPLLKETIHAVGFIPLDSDDVYPILIFRGTPYPAARGFWEAVVSDLHPFRSVGEDLYLAGKKAIHTWMEGKAQIKCYGMSLGGALCYHLGKEYGKRVLVHAFAPPGIRFSKHDRNRVHGVAYFHIDDLVKTVGYHPTGDHFQCYALLTESNRNLMLAHARPAGCSPTVILEINPLHENRRPVRHLVTALRYGLSLLLLPFLYLMVWIRSYRVSNS